MIIKECATAIMDADAVERRLKIWKKRQLR